MKAKLNTCKWCNYHLKGRTDKKFCNDYCRNSFHNQKSQVIRKTTRSINRKLYLNRQLLAEFQKFQIVNKEDLLHLGFDFYHFTHIKVLNDKKKYFFCYDIGYIFISNQKLKIIESQELNDF